MFDIEISTCPEHGNIQKQGHDFQCWQQGNPTTGCGCSPGWTWMPACVFFGCHGFMDSSSIRSGVVFCMRAQSGSLTVSVSRPAASLHTCTMGCSSSKTSKSSQPVPAVYAAPKAEEPAVDSTEPAVTEAKDVQTEQVEQADQVEQVEQVPVSESKDETEKMDIEEAEKAIGDLKESELKMTHVEPKAERAEDTETVTTAPKEDSPRLLDLKVEAAETQSGPCICGSLW